MRIRSLFAVAACQQQKMQCMRAVFLLFIKIVRKYRYRGAWIILTMEKFIFLLSRFAEPHLIW